MLLKSVFMRLGRVLKSKWTICFIGFLALGFLIWFGGPLIAVAGNEPLGSGMSRVLLMTVILLLFVIWQFYRQRRDDRRNQQSVQSLLDGEDTSGDDDESQREVDTLKERIVRALEVLKKSSIGGGQGVYSLPWYVLIGPPGTGKTTALHNSGLEFPLKDKLGDDPLAGVGGTRHCDWWFTNKAVLIDTAGRYTTQDSSSSKDSRAWLGFLGLLKKYRTKRPINGAIVTVSLASLIQQTKTERNLHARAIKQRILELRNQLGMQFPTYVVLTKADLVAGFSEFFADLGPSEREQVWGITFPLAAENKEAGVVGLFNREFHGLLKRLQNRLKQRLQQEHSMDKRTLIYEFPKQMHLLQAAIDDFLKEIFTPNAFEQAPMLRGVYIASATQNGKPIDRVMAETSTGLGLGSVPLTQQSGESRGYFIKRLLEDIIFPEQFLGSVNLQHQKRTRIVRRVAIACSCLALMVCSTLWYNSYAWNKQLVDQSQAAVTEYQQIVDPGLDEKTDIYTLCHALNVLRDMPAGFAQDITKLDVHRMGLYQGDKIGQPSEKAYSRALQGAYGAYLTDVLKEEMILNEEYLEYLYETLKTYLMIYDPEHREVEHIYGWFDAYFERYFPGEVNQDLRRNLMAHTRNLFDNGQIAVAVDEQSIAQARSVLTEMPLAHRAYQRLRLEFLSSHVPDFKLSDVLGRKGRDIIVRPSGLPLNEGIPGLYTYNGYHGLFRIESNRIVKRLMEDSWIYGDSLSLDEATRDAVEKTVDELYSSDFIDAWNNLLGDLKIKPFSSLQEGLVLSKALTSAERPVQSLIAALQKELRLTDVPLSENTKAAGEVAGKVADVALRKQKQKLNRFLPASAPNLNVKLPGAELEAEFESLLSIGESEFEGMHLSFTNLRDYLSQLAESDHKEAYTSMNDEGSQRSLSDALAQTRKSLPAPFGHWVKGLSSQTTALARQGARVHVNEIWKDNVYSEYRQAIKGKYPFSSSSEDDVSLKDFARFFGYGGTMDQFFDHYLKSAVDTSKRTWTLERSIGISARSLQVFQQARRIRDVFFEPGETMPRVEFALKPVSLDSHIRTFRFAFEGQELVYRHDPPRPVHFIWPTQKRHDVRLDFIPPNSGHSISKDYQGSWGFFRMLDSIAEQRPETKADYLLDIDLKGNHASLQLLPASTSHPFWLSDIARFRCPARL